MVDGSHLDFSLISRLNFLDSDTIKKWHFSLKHVITTTHAHLRFEHHKDCKLSLTLGNLKL